MLNVSGTLGESFNCLRLIEWGNYGFDCLGGTSVGNGSVTFTFSEGMKFCGCESGFRKILLWASDRKSGQLS